MPDQVSPLSGLWIPLITPFAYGRLDKASVERLIEHFLNAPVDGLILGATTGECLTLDEFELGELVAVAAKSVGGKVPLYLGLSGSNTKALVSTAKHTGQWPIDGYLISCPYYSRPSQRGLKQHFSAIAGATERPIVLYNIPYRTGVNLLNETILELAEFPNIIGLKDCCTDQNQTFELLQRKPSDFSVMTGEDVHYYSALAHGAEGAILASAHIETAKFAAVCERLVAGDAMGALRQWCEIADLTRLLFAEPSPAAIKYWLWRKGLIGSPELRLPMTDVSPSLAAEINRAMAATEGLRETERVAGV